MTVHRNKQYLWLFASLLIGMLTILPAPAHEEFKPAKLVPRLSLADAHKKPILSAYLANKYKRPLSQTEKIVRAAFREGRELGLPPELILGIIAKESSFQPTAESGYGAKGLMQVVPRFHEKLLKTYSAGNPFHVEGNIKVGSRILKQYMVSAGGDLRKALARYSGGSSNYHAKVTGYWSEYTLVSLAAAQNDRAL